MFRQFTRGLRGTLLAAATMLTVLPGAASAASVDMTTFTCAQFQNSVPVAQYALLFWLEGFRADETAEGVNEADLDRSFDVINAACDGHPMTPLLEAIGVLHQARAPEAAARSR